MLLLVAFGTDKEYEMNARGAWWDLCLNKPYNNGEGRHAPDLSASWNLVRRSW